MGFFLFLICAYGGALFFIWKGVTDWLSTVASILHTKVFYLSFTVLYLLVAATPVIWVFIQNAELKAFIKKTSDIWIGIFIFSVLIMALAYIVTIFLRVLKKVKKGGDRWRGFVVVRGTLAAFLIVCLCVYGLIHAEKIKMTSYDIDVYKPCGPANEMKIVMVADLHMGYHTDQERIHAIVEAINRQNPDLVCIAGDIFDNDYMAVDEPEEIIKEFKSIKSTYGVYACYGNHDVDENRMGGFEVPSGSSSRADGNMEDFMEAANVKMLNDEAVYIEKAFYLVGRLDFEKPFVEKRATAAALTQNLNKLQPIIMMDHEPNDLQAEADAGVDLVLSGHTHNGQVFPGNLLMKFIWENPFGYLKKDEMHSIVTSGVGIWGPAMRVGTDCEITVINVGFRKP